MTATRRRIVSDRSDAIGERGTNDRIGGSNVWSQDHRCRHDEREHVPSLVMARMRRARTQSLGSFGGISGTTRAHENPQL